MNELMNSKSTSYGLSNSNTDQNWQ